MCTAIIIIIIIITLRRKVYGSTHIIINLLTSRARMYKGSAVTGRVVGRGGGGGGEVGNLIILLLGIR